MAYQQQKTPIDTAVDELRRHWPTAALGNFGDDSEKVVTGHLENTVRMAASSPCRPPDVSIAEYASGLLWGAHQLRLTAEANAHGSVKPLSVLLAADPLARS